MYRGMPYRRPVVAALAFGLSLALLLLTAAPSPAPVEPRNCGIIKVKGKRYQVKADQIRCRTAKTRARRYIRSESRPSGYRCRSYDSSTKLEFRCWKGKRVYFAIRR